MDSKKTPQVVALILFFSFLAIYILLMYGRPFSLISDDLFWLKRSGEMSTGDLTKELFLGPVQGYDVTSRSVQTVFTKVLMTLFGMRPEPFMFETGVFYALAGVLVFLFIYKATTNIAFSTLGALFFATAGPVIDTTISFFDKDITAQAFLMLSVYLYLKSDLTQLSHKQYPLRVLGIAFSAFLAIKTKEPGLMVIPLLLFCYFLREQSRLKVLLGRNLLIALFALFLLTFAIRPAPIGGGSSLPHGGWLYEKLVVNPASGYTVEQYPVIFSPHQWIFGVPGSVLGFIGFPLGWLLLFITVLMLVNASWRASCANLFNNEVLKMAVFWLLLVIFMFSFFKLSVLRYLDVVIAPLSIVLFSVLKLFTEWAGKHYRIATMGITLVCFLTIGVNAQHSFINVAGGFNARVVGIGGAVESICEDISPEHMFSYEAITPWFTPSYKNQPKPENMTLVQDVTVSSVMFIVHDQPTPETIAEKLKRNGVVYAIVLGNDVIPNATLLKAIEPCGTWLYCQLKNRIKKQEPRFFVYKLSTNRTPSKPLSCYLEG